MNKQAYLSALKAGDIDLEYIQDEINADNISQELVNEIIPEYLEWCELRDRKGIHPEIDKWAEELFKDFIPKEKDVIDKQGDIFTWGTPESDKKFTPIESHHHIIFAGDRGSGKTAFSFDMAKKNAQYHKVLYISLEMIGEAIATRAARDRAAITKEQWRNKELIGESQKELYRKTKDELMNMDNLELWGCAVGDTPNITHILEVIEAKNPKLVFVDNFNLVQADDPKEKNVDDVVSKAFMDFTNQHKIPIIVLHHENKSGGLRGSKKIEDNADGIFVCSRDQDPNQEDKKERARFTVIEKKDREFGNGGIHNYYFYKGEFSDTYGGEYQAGF